MQNAVNKATLTIITYTSLFQANDCKPTVAHPCPRIESEGRLKSDLHICLDGSENRSEYHRSKFTSTGNVLSHRRSRARIGDTLRAGTVNSSLRSPSEGPQTRIFTEQPCHSIPSGKNIMNYEDKSIKGAWNRSVSPKSWSISPTLPFLLPQINN